MRHFLHFRLLLKKHFILMKRAPFQTAFEIILPVILFALVCARFDSGPTYRDGEFYDATADLLERVPISMEDMRAKLARYQFPYFPSNNMTDRVMNEFKSLLRQDRGGVKPTSSKEEFVIALKNKSTMYSMGIEFTTIDETTQNIPKKIGYKIRVFSDEGDDWHLRSVYPERRRYSHLSGNPYMRGGAGVEFVGAQIHLNLAIAIAAFKRGNVASRMQHCVETLGKMNYEFRAFPYARPDAGCEEVLVTTQSRLFLLLYVSYIFVVPIIINQILKEKETKVREVLKMMGVRNWIIWMSWFFRMFFVQVAVMGLITVLLTVRFSSNFHKLKHSDPFMIFLFLILYAMSTVSFSFCISVFFNSPRRGAIFGMILFASTIGAPLAVKNDASLNILFSLFQNLPMARGFFMIGIFEDRQEGIQWSNYDQLPDVDARHMMTFDTVLLMLVFDTLLYGLITWYIDAVFPGEYGIPQKWYFLCQPSYWCNIKHEKETSVQKPVEENPNFFEQEPSGLNAGVRAFNIRKEFTSQGARIVAIAGTSLNAYEGQVTCLLGHNGAGKTTFLSVITGFLPATSGEVFVNEHSIRTDLDKVRDSLGICPQHDILFSNLTVYEHLEFFAGIKGCPSRWISSEAQKWLLEVGLSSKKNARAKTLSGGMKRKLSVACCLIADSKVVILDEPSAGIDPQARSEIWDILKRHKENRTVLLTTHYMEEADLLSDRIAIMAEGVIKCCGSSLFLKTKFGAGYHLTVVTLPGCAVDEITSVIKTYVPTVLVNAELSGDLYYTLPNESRCHFGALFTELEENKASLGIDSFGVSITTLEDVFIKVGEGLSNDVIKSNSSLGQPIRSNGILTTEAPVVEIETNLDTVKPESIPSGDNSIGQHVPPLDIVQHNNTFVQSSEEGCSLVLQQFWALLIKRVTGMTGSKFLTLFQLFAPMLIALMAALAALALKETADVDLSIRRLDFPADFPKAVLPYGVFSTAEPRNSTKIMLECTGMLIENYKALLHRKWGIRVQKQTVVGGIRKHLASLVRADAKKVQNDFIIGQFYEVDHNQSKVISHTIYNELPYHTFEHAVNALGTMILQSVVDENISIEVYNQPFWERRKNADVSGRQSMIMKNLLVASGIAFGLCLLTTSFLVFPMRESTTGFKQIQVISGLDTWLYWGSCFFSDLIVFALSSALVVIVIVCTESHDFRIVLTYLIPLFAMYGWTATTFSYVCSYLSNDATQTSIRLTLIYLILLVMSTFMSSDISFTFSKNSLRGDDFQDYGRILSYIFPIFNLVEAMLRLKTNHINRAICLPFNSLCQSAKDMDMNRTVMTCCPNACPKEGKCLRFVINDLSLEEPGIGQNLLAFLGHALIYIFITYALETKLVRKCAQPRDVPPSHSDTEDSDVKKERERLRGAKAASEVIVVRDLVKVFGNFKAVDGLSFGISPKECFGLLGVNGAGKTTAFKLITDQLLPTSGSIILSRCTFGLCPQFGGLLDELTVKETLKFMARIRGIENHSIQQVVNDLAKDLLLDEHMLKRVGHLSGGNKRKVSTALAVLGNPSLIILDEPTCGIDPVARRQLWNVLEKVRRNGSTLILTSHNMEECEALCSRVGIMVNGALRCIGTTQHLKNKFSEGCTIVARLAECESSTDYVAKLVSILAAEYPSGILKSSENNVVVYQLPGDTANWASVFKFMEQSLETCHIDDYSVSQTTLDQVFNYFALSQTQPVLLPSSCKDVLCGCYSY